MDSIDFRREALDMDEAPGVRDKGGEQRVDDYLRMHDLFLIALLAEHPEPRQIRGQFRTLLAGLTASHARLAFDETFLMAIRRSALRLDGMLELVISSEVGGAGPRGRPAVRPLEIEAASPY
jgi:hypothetical protein